MERNDARFWRSSRIKSFAMANSRNRSGRAGANSETALRTVVGSNGDILMWTWRGRRLAKARTSQGRHLDFALPASGHR